MNVTTLSDGIVRITREDGNSLGIPTGFSKKAFSLMKLTERKATNGWYVHDNVIEEWKIEGFIESDETIYVTGPYHEGKLLSQVIRFPDEDKLPYLKRLAEALALIEERSLELPPLFTNGVLFTDSGGVLFFPPRFMQVIKNNQPLSYRLTYYEPYNHPDLSGTENLSFALGALSYLMLTGELPFFSEHEEELRLQIRDRAILSPLFRRPELQPEISNLIMTALGKASGKRPTLEAWVRHLSQWSAEGVTRRITEEERSHILSQAEDVGKKHETAYRIKNFLRRRGSTILIAVAAVTVVGWIAGSILQNVLAPRVTRGFSPEEVVSTFYTSINSFDHLTMEDCVVDNAGKPLLTEVMNLFVVTRMRYSYEGTTGFLPADDWVLAGRPVPPEGYSVYGVANLFIEPAPAPSPAERAFTVKYEKWLPHQSDTPPSAEDVAANRVLTPIAEGYERTERVFLRQDREDWVIYRIEELSAEMIGTVGPAASASPAEPE
jgi:hypothetical protein